MSDGSFWRDFSQWLYGGTSLLGLACSIALLVTITTVVRRHRPDAHRGLQTWAIASLVVFVGMTLARLILPRIALTGDGMSTYFKWSGMLTILGMFFQVGLLVLHIRGLVALAQPPKPINVEGAPPYR